MNDKYDVWCVCCEKDGDAMVPRTPEITEKKKEKKIQYFPTYDACSYTQDVIEKDECDFFLDFVTNVS